MDDIDDVENKDFEVCGPFDDIDKAVDAACGNDSKNSTPAASLGQLQVAARRVKDANFVKVYKGKAGYYWCGSDLESMGDGFMKGPFNSKQDAIYKATRETSFKRLLLNKCQEEFEKENIFDQVLSIACVKWAPLSLSSFFFSRQLAAEFREGG